MRWMKAVTATRTAWEAASLRRPWAGDALLAVGLAVGTVAGNLNRSYVEVFPGGLPGPVSGLPPARPEPPGWPDPDLVALGPGRRPVPAVEHTLAPAEAWEWVLVLLTALALVLRRRCPLAVYGTVTATVVVLHQWGDVAPDATTVMFASELVAAYSAAVYSPHRWTAVAALAVGSTVYVANELVPDVDQGLIPLLVLVPVGLAAQVVHAWRRRARTLRAEQEETVRRALERERARIARELHDVVTHNVSMMTIQAGAARKVLGSSPEQAREAMLAVESAGRTAMSELRHVMGLLTMAAADGTAEAGGRSGTDPDHRAEGPDPGLDMGLDMGLDLGLAPQPGIDRIGDLVDGVRATGVPVELTMRTGSVDPPPGVGLAVYRVVQEALTNAVRHAEGARVRVAVTHARGELCAEVTDTGGRARADGTASGGESGGRGLVGLRERLAVYGGTLQAGRHPGGGYRVRAVIPLAGREDA
ncbi:sensor histidine kinase [Streptomyces sp. NPDC053493]|uniref:sensor histidine kinase n=1 Tax=Streptomyces sp. NPDC053493 TaxID=3365705 RepID=UPI0037D029D7